MRKALLVLLVIPLLVSLSSAELSPVPCKDWYDFPNFEFSGLSVDKPSYSPGETVTIRATALNTNPFPVVEGSIRAHIIYLDGEEEYILDEFYIANDFNLLPDEHVSVESSWQLPASAKAGTYRVAAHFISADSFNLAGVSFLRGIYGEMTSFQVTGGTELLYFDTANLIINGEPQPLHELARPFLEGTSVEVSIPIKNEGAATEAEIIYELYSWDDLIPGDLLTEYGKQETLSLGAGGSKLLTYDLPSTAASDAYLLKVTATSAKNNAILKVRIPILGRAIKLNFAGLDSFPLNAGEPVTIFLCVSNTAEASSGLVLEDEEVSSAIQDASLRLSIEADGETVFQDSSDGLEMGGMMKGYQTTFTPDSDYTRLTLRVEAEDDGDSDSVEMAYHLDMLYKNADISLDASVSGREVTASVRLEKAGYPATGLITLYALNGEGTVVYMMPDVRVSGSYEQTFGLEPGKYTIKAMDLDSWDYAEADVEVAETAPPIGPSEPAERKGDSTVLVVVLVILVFMAVLFYTHIKRKKIRHKKRKK